MALLAHLQHYGAATPLLDVSTDPLIALWMVAFANPADPAALDDRPGSLFVIRRPPRERWISALDARPYTTDQDASGRTAPTVAASLGDQVWWYRAPDVTERLRIQRGSGLLYRAASPPSQRGPERYDAAVGPGHGQGRREHKLPWEPPGQDGRSRNGEPRVGRTVPNPSYSFRQAAPAQAPSEDRSGLSIAESTRPRGTGLSSSSSPRPTTGADRCHSTCRSPPRRLPIQRPDPRRWRLAMITLVDL